MRHRNKNMIISLLLCCVLVMTIGYAIYNKRLNIDGVSNISSVYDVRFTNITSTTSGLATNMSLPSYTNTTATFSADLKAPGDEIIYKITVSNLGTLDAKLLLVTMSDAQNPAIDFKYTGVKVGDILPAGQSTIVTVTVKFDKSITDEPEVMDSDLTIKLDYGQTDETTVDEIINTEAYLASVSYKSDELWLNGPLSKDSIESVNFTTTSIVPEDVGNNYWDASEQGNNAIMAWYYDNDSDGLYEVTIGQYNGVKANPNSGHLFHYFEKLTSVDFTNFDTAGVTNMECLFSGASSIESIDFSNFDTSNVKYMNGMFYYAKSLKELDLSMFDTSKVTSMDSMFNGTYAITKIDASNFDTSKVTGFSMMFQMSNVEEFIINEWDTSSATNMMNMFYQTSNLKNLDVSNWDTSNVKNMYQLFWHSKSIQKLDVSKWNTSNVKDMGRMFSYCTSLTELDVSKWNTSKVEIMEAVFNGLKNVEVIDVSKWDTSSATDMSSMFSSTDSVKILDLRNFDTSIVETMASMFSYSGVKEILVDDFDTSKVKDMSDMFYSTINLTNFNFNILETDNVENMRNIFNDKKDEIIDISKWNTSKVTDMTNMFRNNVNLTTIYVGDGWNTNAVTTSTNMFYGSTKLKGAVSYSANNANDVTFANYTTGYFTYKTN